MQRGDEENVGGEERRGGEEGEEEKRLSIGSRLRPSQQIFYQTIHDNPHEENSLDWRISHVSISACSHHARP